MLNTSLLQTLIASSERIDKGAPEVEEVLDVEGVRGRGGRTDLLMTVEVVLTSLTQLVIASGETKAPDLEETL